MNPASTIAPGLDFVFANLHGRWSGFLRGDELQRVVQSGSPDILMRALVGHGMQVAELGEARTELVRHLGAELKRAADLLGGSLGAFHIAFLRRFWYENLKTILHARIAAAHDVDVGALLVDLPMLPRLPTRQILEATSDGEVVQRAKAVGKEIGALVGELVGNGDIPRADAGLDRLFFADLQQAADRCPRAGRQLAGELVGIEIDTVNLVTILRNRRTYQLPKEELLALCIPGGPATDGRRLEKLVDAQSPAAAAALLPRHLANCLRDRQLDEVAAVENALRELLHARARAAFRDCDRPVYAALAYPYLKWTEIVNLGRVCEGMRFGMLPPELSPLLIGETRHA